MRARLPLIVTLLAGALLGSTRLGSLDLPLMLAGGDVILDSGVIPRTNEFSWANPTHPYLNDKWLFMVAVAAVERLGGIGGLAALKVAFGAGAGGILFALARRRTDPWPAAGLACLGLTMLSYRLHLRAEWVSFLFLGGFLLALPGVIAGRRLPTSLVVVATPVWSAFHGYWPLGPLVIAAGAIGSGSRRAGLVAAACLASAVLSPFGVRNLLHPLHVASQLGGELSEAISELRAPFVSGAPFTFFHALALSIAAGAVVSLVALARRREWASVPVAALILVAGLRIDRNLALLGLLPPVLFVSRTGRMNRWICWSGLVAVVALAGTLGGVPWIAGNRKAGWGTHEGRHPVELAQALAEADGESRLVNDLGIGSFLVRARGTAFIDGNTEGYPASFLSTYRRMLTGELDLAEVDRAYPNDGYLLRHGAPATRVVILGLFLRGGDAPTRWDRTATLFRPDVPQDEADRLWRTWFEEVYLSHAAPWFATARQAQGIAATNGLRAALDACPYHRPLYERLAERLEAEGRLLAAAKVSRLGQRLPAGLPVR